AVAVILVGGMAELLGARIGVGGLGQIVAYGWATHVLADAVTAGGVPLLWPLRRRRVRLPWGIAPPTGGRMEALTVLGTVLLSVWWGALRLTT
ncbi:MAG: metal-dependent hydrolase, partial [Chloroflexota bacterium]|nr:metal-dependent hydrolase [Chloroflexota bacterium]